MSLGIVEREIGFSVMLHNGDAVEFIKAESAFEVSDWSEAEIRDTFAITPAVEVRAEKLRELVGIVE